MAYARNGLGKTAMCAVSLAALACWGAACGGDGEVGQASTTGSGDVLADGLVDGEADGAQSASSPLEAIAERERMTLPGLSAPVHVAYTEMGVPHIYAESREDLGRTLGYLLGRDRYFVMDLQRRLGLGTLSELLGDSALERDQENRGIGMAYVADRLVDHLSPSMKSYLEAVADGLNHYILQVGEGQVQPPSELETLYPLLGADSSFDLMVPWDVRSLASMVAVVMYETTFEGGDVGRTAKAESLQTIFTGDGAEEPLRRTGFLGDVAYEHRALFEAHSAPGLGIYKSGAALDEASTMQRQVATPSGPSASEGQVRNGGAYVHPSIIERMAPRLKRLQRRLLRDEDKGFGSNAWAVAASHALDGWALVAGDGHLPLSVPPLFYQVGLNTEHLGGGDIAQLGMLLTGLPVLAVGTNGKVGWSQVNPVTDNTDWYAEKVQLDDDGLPEASLWKDEWQPLQAHEEAIDIAQVDILGSEGRTETWKRWTTFDGRWLVDIEGRVPSEDEPAGEGESIVYMQGNPIVPADMDGDGHVTAVSFDYAALDSTAYIDTLERLGRAQDVVDYQDITRGIVGSGLFSAVADSAGSVLFSSYQALPCRTHLARDADGAWSTGANPTLLLDGNQYGGFTLPTDAEGAIDESQAEDPSRCVMPFTATPQAIDPEEGFVYTANNDPGMLTADGDGFNDAWYMGGPWSSVRAHTIQRELTEAVADQAATGDDMAAIQGNIDSRLGELFAPHLLAAINRGKDLSASGAGSESQERVKALYEARAGAFDEVAARLEAWATLGYRTPSGVDTFYDQPTAEDREASVATMIFNAWIGRFLQGVWNDEPVGDPWLYSGDRMRTRATRRFLEGRGDDNPGDLASWNATTGESIFFDSYGTDEIETSDEIILTSLDGALGFLEGDGDGPGQGGFGTDDQDAWLWGLRHQVRFESLLAEFLSGDPTYGFLVDLFSIDTSVLPLAEGIPNGDPRKGLKWFPRGGDQWCVDAANPGLGGTSFSHSNGPVMRMVIELRDGEVRGRNILPGGQSALTDSEHFADQAALWLGNDTVPLRFAVEDVVEGATLRDVFEPAGESSQEAE